MDFPVNEKCEGHNEDDCEDYKFNNECAGCEGGTYAICPECNKLICDYYNIDPISISNVKFGFDNYRYVDKMFKCPYCELKLEQREILTKGEVK